MVDPENWGDPVIINIQHLDVVDNSWFCEGKSYFSSSSTVVWALLVAFLNNDDVSNGNAVGVWA